MRPVTAKRNFSDYCIISESTVAVAVISSIVNIRSLKEFLGNAIA
jgi:hypothetical protein